MHGGLTPAILRQFFRGYTTYQIANDLGCSRTYVYHVLKNHNLKQQHDIVIHGIHRHWPDQPGYDFYRVIDRDFDDLRTSNG